MSRPVSMAVVVCVATFGLGACQSLPEAPDWPRFAELGNRWSLFSHKPPAVMADPPMMKEDPPPVAVVPVATHVSDEFMMRLDVLDADIAKLKRQLADALKENARLKKELDDAQQDNMLLRDLASKKGR